jgi:hypothetical protein
MAKPVGLPGDDRRLDRQLLGIAALDPLISDPEDCVADPKIADPGAKGTDHAGKIAAQDMRKFEATAGAGAEPHLVVGGVDARRPDVDDDLARTRDRVRRIAIVQHLGSAVSGQQHCLHRVASAALSVSPIFPGKSASVHCRVGLLCAAAPCRLASVT